jgi:hypothetical protein
MKRNKNRAEGNTTLTVSLPEELKTAWEQEAERQHRSKSNLFVLIAEAYLDGRLQETPHDEGNTIDPANGGGQPPRKVSYRTTKRKTA